MVNWPLGLRSHFPDETKEEKMMVEEPTVEILKEESTEPIAETIQDAAPTEEPVEVEVIAENQWIQPEETQEPIVEVEMISEDEPADDEIAEPEIPIVEIESIPESELQQTQEIPVMSDATDIAATAKTIHDRFENFETEFAATEDAQGDLLQQIIVLMKERNELLTSLRDHLKTENELLKSFSAEKTG